MARILILGTAAAVRDTTHDNTHFLLIGDHGMVLVDCGSNPLGKFQDAPVSEEYLQDVVLTHFHPDHVSGVPNMLMHMWQLGRQKPLRFYGLHHCMSRMEDMLYAFSWHEWPNFFPVTFNRITDRFNAPVLDNEDFLITAWPVQHFIPTVGLRILNKQTGKVLAYTCDTNPTPSLLELAQGADMLLHESAGFGFGHSSARQAGETATITGAKSLYLIHYWVWNTDPAPLVTQAAETYDGPITLCQDYDMYEF
jgi:ribonuclease Z